MEGSIDRGEITTIVNFHGFDSRLHRVKIHTCGKPVEENHLGKSNCYMNRARVGGEQKLEGRGEEEAGRRGMRDS